jgi:excisionase family DNA binding protein
MSADTDPILTYLEAAGALKVSVRQVKNLIHRGELPAITVGLRSRRVSRIDLDAYIERRRDANNAPVQPLPFPSAGLVRNRRKAAALT